MRSNKKQTVTQSSEELRKQLKKNVFLVITTFLALCMIGIAWFVNNTRVSANSVSIQSQGSRFEVATKKESGSSRNVFNIDKLFNLYSSDTEEGAYDISTDDRSLSLFLTGNTNFSNDKQTEQLMPGSYGKITFYFHPVMSDIEVVYLELLTEAYRSNGKLGESETVTALSETDKGIGDYLLDGHILFFQNYNESTKQYSDWIHNDLAIYPFNEAGKAIIVPEGSDKPNGAANYFTSGQYYEITLYWIWPKYFRNYAYLLPAQGDLFSDAENVDYKNLMVDMNKNESAKKYFYKLPDEGADPSALQEKPVLNITSAMNNTDFNLCTLYYNQGDEYLGEQVDYVLFKALVKE